jgi:hypothetical protein
MVPSIYPLMEVWMIVMGFDTDRRHDEGDGRSEKREVRK